MPNTRNPLRVAVIGFGQWGPNHVRIFQLISGCRVTLVCDSGSGRLAAARKQFPGVRTALRPSSVFSDAEVDAVVVATPVQTHFALARQALLSGKHVLCEKPLTVTAAQSVLLRELARERGLKLMVGHVFLYNPGILHLKHTIASGALGPIYYMDAVRTNLGPVRRDVSVLYDLASHDIAIFNFLLDSRPSAVSATGSSFLQKGVPDICFMSVAYPNGSICHVHTSWLNPRKVRQLTVVGSRKMAVWDDMNNLEPIRYYDKSLEQATYSSFGEFHMVLREGAITVPKIKSFEPLLKQDLEFRDCVREHRTPAACAAFAADVVYVLEAAARSIRAGGKMVGIRYA